MPFYNYTHCVDFEVRKPMSECARIETCPECGKPSERVYTAPPILWGWILTEASHHKGSIDRWVPNKPTNGMIVDNTKAHYEKTLF